MSAVPKGITSTTVKEMKESSWEFPLIPVLLVWGDVSEQTLQSSQDQTLLDLSSLHSFR